MAAFIFGFIGLFIGVIGSGGHKDYAESLFGNLCWTAFVMFWWVLAALNWKKQIEKEKAELGEPSIMRLYSKNEAALNLQHSAKRGWWIIGIGAGWTFFCCFFRMLHSDTLF